MISKILHDGSANIEPNLPRERRTFSLLRKSTANHDIKSVQELQIEYFPWVMQQNSACEMTDGISLRSYIYILQHLRKNQSQITFQVTSSLKITFCKADT